jgi:hypothetical protein
MAMLKWLVAVVVFVSISIWRVSETYLLFHSHELADYAEQHEIIINPQNYSFTEETSEDIPPFWPVRALHSYKMMHSIEALSYDTDPNRKFALVTYWCPDRAGNILHNMFSSVIWSIITNRTVLWKYEATDNVHVRNKPTSIDDRQFCEEIMELAKWLPSWDEWKVKLKLEDPVAIPIERTRLTFDESIQTVIFPQIPDIDSKNTRIHRIEWGEHPLDNPRFRSYISEMSEYQKVTAGMLYYDGIDFLYGMLLRELFNIKASTAIDKQIPADSFTIAVHSRHIVHGDDGSYINEEVDCLNEMMPRSKDTGCAVYIMSDREKSLHLLTEWAHSRNCTAVVASHDEYDESIVEEHGPFSGKGFIQDLAVASLARSGVIGDIRRSSFKLLLELVTYDREMDAWSRQLDRPSKLLTCKLPYHKVTGYDYGPGTPSFVRRRWLSPLVPVQVIEEYQKHHSASIVSTSMVDRSFVVGTYACPQDRGDLDTFLNTFLYAIVTNQTFVWHYDALGHCDSTSPCPPTLQECNQLIQPKSWLPSLSNSTWLTTSNLVSSNKHGSYQVYVNSQPLSSFNKHTFVQHLNKQPYAQIHDKLLAHGIDYLYGMLFDRLFDIADRPEFDFTSDAGHIPASKDCSVAFDDIELIQDPAQKVTKPARLCLDNLLSSRQGKCSVYTSHNSRNNNSNKAINIDLDAGTSHEKIIHHSDAVLTSLPAKSGYDYSMQFLRKMLFLSQSRHGYVGKESEKSNLILERIQYLRHDDTWALGRVPPIFPNFTECMAG